MLDHNYVGLLSTKPTGLPLWQYFFYVKTGVGWVYGTAGLTGDCLIIILFIMVLCSLPCVRRKGFFEVRHQQFHDINASLIPIPPAVLCSLDKTQKNREWLVDRANKLLPAVHVLRLSHCSENNDNLFLNHCIHHPPSPLSLYS